MATDMTTKLDNIQFCKSGFSVDRFLSIKYFTMTSSTQREQVDTLNFLNQSVQSINACIDIKLRMICVLKYAVQRWVHRIEEKNHPEQVYRYKKLNDASADVSRGIRDTILKLGCVRFPVDNEDIDYFEETKDGKMSINAWEISRTQLHYSK